MTIKEFINKHQSEIQMLMTYSGCNREVDRQEMEMWVMNTEELYSLAIKEGVDI